MKRNFRIEDGVVVRVGDLFADLHNSQDFVGFALNSVRDELILSFAANEWRNPSEAETVSLSFAGVQIKGFTLDLKSEDGRVVDEIGFRRPDDDDDPNWSSDHMQVDADADLVLRFLDGGWLRLQADAVTVTFG